MRNRPEIVFDEDLRYERASLPWERTAVPTMVAGTLLARHAAQDAHVLLAGFGRIELVEGGVVLVWAGRHERLHGRLRVGEPVTHPHAVRWIGRSTVAAAAVYRGWHARCVRDDRHDELVDAFVPTLELVWPEVVLQSKDFAQQDASCNGPRSGAS